MEFRENKAIYIQIGEYVCECILIGVFKNGDKLPSVREMAVQLEVNPNTVMRTYDLLQQKGIINNKRGIGFFLTDDAVLQVKNYRRNAFIGEELPALFSNMYLLDIDFAELKSRYEQFIQQYITNLNHENKQ